MSISEDHIRLAPLWKKAKTAQWERIAGSISGLQCVTSGELGTTFMLVCSIDPGEGEHADTGFYEGVVFGRLPLLLYEFKRGRAGQQVKVPLPEHKRPIGKRAVDFSDAELDQVIAAWKEGRSVIGLTFVAMVWGRDGQGRDGAGALALARQED